MKPLRMETNIDKLKVCYIQPAPLFNSLSDAFASSNNNILDYSEFQLQLDHTELNPDNQVIKMVASVHYYMDGSSHRLGEFEFSVSGKYKGLCFFTFDNKALYTLFEYNQGVKCNVIGFIFYVTEQLGLEFNNVTLAEICMDTNKNIITAIRKYIKDYEEYDMFLNGNLVHDKDRKLENYGEYYSRSRKKICRQPTLYLHQKKQYGLGLKIYNKTIEIKEASCSKDYIKDWLGYGNQTIYRAELTIRNTDFRDFCSLTGEENGSLLLLLTSPEWRNKLWAYSVNRIIYFRSKKDGTDVELADMLIT